MNEIVTTNPRPTPVALANAMAALAGDAAARNLSRGGPVDGLVDAQSAAETAADWNTSTGLVQLSCDRVTRPREELEAVAALGLSDQHDGAIQLTYEHVARFSPSRILAAALPEGFQFVPTENGVNVRFPGGMVMSWGAAVRQRLLSIEPGPVAVEG